MWIRSYCGDGRADLCAVCGGWCERVVNEIYDCPNESDIRDLGPVLKVINYQEESLTL